MGEEGLLSLHGEGGLRPPLTPPMERGGIASPPNLPHGEGGGGGGLRPPLTSPMERGGVRGGVAPLYHNENFYVIWYDSEHFHISKIGKGGGGVPPVDKVLLDTEH